MEVLRRLLNRFRKIKSSIKTSKTTNQRFKPLNDELVLLEAGFIFLDRCSKSEVSSINRVNKFEVEIIEEIQSSQCCMADDIEFIPRPRRNAVYELSDDERYGFTYVLKGYIQATRLREYGML